jgi:D-alanyl-D-alanine carboxypeptidase/D-alanyl-D-alanine-endopeptidase (penicillin-binding protein 4)
MAAMSRVYAAALATLARAAAVLALAAAGVVAPAAAAGALPSEALEALRRAGIAPEGISVVVAEVGSGRDVLHWQEKRPRNPASLAKLLVSAAALDRLGPAWTWATPVWLAGPLRDGVLEGSVFIKGSGDPKFVLERVWLLLRRLQQHGVREIRGDIVLDQGAFAVAEASPGEFDGEPLRPYNVQPAALLFNFRSVLYTFVPDRAAGVAHVLVEPPLDGTRVQHTVPLSAGPCQDWRGALKASFEPGLARFAGSYASACGESAWPVADPQPATFEARLLATLWREMGGRLQGSVHAGTAPQDASPSFELRSPALAELVRDMNKYSNNLMAQQLLLTLALQAAPGMPATPEAGREWLARWLAQQGAGSDGSDRSDGDEIVIDNGSGLSRHTRISAGRLARILLQSYAGPTMSELMSSLPIVGLDGTLRRSQATPGRAHLKTGSLRDVAGVAGYVLADSGRRYVLVAIVNHPRALVARPVLDALVRWTMRDAPAR